MNKLMMTCLLGILVAGVVGCGKTNPMAPKENPDVSAKLNTAGFFDWMWQYKCTVAFTQADYSSGLNQFFSPRQIAVDSSGLIFIADPLNHRVSAYATGLWYVGAMSMGGHEKDLRWPKGVAFGSSFYCVTDAMTNLVRVYDQGAYYCWGGPGKEPSGSAQPKFDGLGFCAVSNDLIVVCDTNNSRLVLTDKNGKIKNTITRDKNGTQLLGYPKAVAVSQGFTGTFGFSIYVTDDFDRVVKIDYPDNTWHVWGSKGSANGQFANPQGIATDKYNNVYVADCDNHRIQKYDGNGNYLKKWGSYGFNLGQFNRPYGVAVDNQRRVYVTDMSSRVQVFEEKSIVDSTVSPDVLNASPSK